MVFKKNTNILFCFSPPVMLATLIIEFTLAVYTTIRYKIDTTSRLAIAILITLGLFQLSEYMICGGFGLTHAEWVKFGYVMTALLPAFGIHLIINVAGKKKTMLIAAAYIMSAFFICYYTFNGNAINGQECYANYAVFYAHGVVSQFFSLYYFLWLSIGGYLAWHWSNRLPSKRKSLRAILLGGLIFLVPTYFFNIIDPATVNGIPSIMCGFAVLFALLLVAKVLPNSCKLRTKPEAKLSVNHN